MGRIAFGSVSCFSPLKWLLPNYRICSNNLVLKKLLSHDCHECVDIRLASTDVLCIFSSIHLYGWISLNYPKFIWLITWPNVQPAPLGLTLKPNRSSGSLQRRSQIAPSCGTYWNLSSLRMSSRVVNEGDKPPWVPNICP